MYAQHDDDIWRPIRDHYIFNAFDSNNDLHLDLLEFRMLIYSLLYTSKLNYSEDAVIKGTNAVKKSVITTIVSTKLQKKDWLTSELGNRIPNCKNIFRIPLSIELFINLRNNNENDFKSKALKLHEKNSQTVEIKKKTVRIHEDHSVSMSMLQSGVHTKETFRKVDTPEKNLFGDDVEDNQNSIILETLTKRVIKNLLLPPCMLSLNKFTLLSIEQIYQLCIATRDILAEEPNIVNISPPTKVYGDIHGHLKELLVLFKIFGSPNHYMGDVELISYVFNGDFVDRGPHSLEVICLLFSLKVLYPKQIYLIRGNHEDSIINKEHGFFMECKNRLPKEYGKPLWELINHVFTFLPVGGLIRNKILVVHGGIGPSFSYLSQILSIPKPIIDVSSIDIIRDILWSDPTESDTKQTHASHRGKGITKYDRNQVLEFCKNNNLELIIRSHECVEKGYEFFSDGRLITIFSAGNYCSKGNDAALLTISSKLSVRAKSISTKTILVTNLY